MKTKSVQLVLSVVFIIAGTLGCYGQTKAKKSGNKEVSLLNGKDFKNWVFYLKDHSVDPTTVFTFKDGILHVSGTPFGYIRTKETYSDYKLHVEWRWPVEGTNSGVWVHGQLPDTIWLQGLECQLQAGNAGDFACVGAVDMKERIDKSSKGRMIKKMAPSSEKPIGEWNTMDIICKGNTVEVTVNGVLQNKGTEVSLSSGFICLQSEGKEIEFKKVILTKL